MKKRKPTSTLRTVVPAHDATDDTWLDTIQEQIQEMNRVAAEVTAFRAAHPYCLSVPYAWLMKEFLAKAKQVYREAHPPHLKRGRRSEENAAIDHLRLMRSHELGPPPTQGAMLKWLMAELKLSKNTAGKYAKLYRLSRQDTARFSQAEQRWLCKEFGAESLSPAWWDTRFWQWFGAKVTSSGLGDDIRKIFAGGYTQAELQQIQSEMLIQHQERKAERITLRRQQKDVTNAPAGRTKEPRPTRSRKSPQ